MDGPKVLTLFTRAARASLLTVVVALPYPHAMAAGEILDTQGWEGYSAGALDGQPAGSSSWLTVGGGGGAATVENSIGVDNSKGLRVERGAGSDDWWLVSFPDSTLPATRYVVVDWDMKVEATNAAEGVFGPFMGVQAVDASPAVSLLAALGVDASTRDILFQDAGTGALTETGWTVAEDWHHYQIRMDFERAQYAISVDYEYATPSPIPFVDGVLDSFGDADIADLAADTTTEALNQTGTAIFDNYVVSEVAQLPGDYNDDGIVDIADYTVWRNHRGAAAGALPNDVDGGIIAAAQYATWKTGFQFAPSDQPLAAAAIPEPSSMTMVCLLGLASLYMVESEAN